MADDLRWTNVLDMLPPEGVEVMTLSPGRMEQSLKRRGRLWFVPDGSIVGLLIGMVLVFGRQVPPEPQFTPQTVAPPVTTEVDGG